MSIYKAGVWTQNSFIESLPFGYTELEYIESTGTQYINTGILGKNNIQAETDVIFTSIPNDGCLLGSRTGNNRIYLFYIYPGKFNLGYGNNYTSTITPIANQKYKLKAELNAGQQNLFINGVNILTQNVVTTINSEANLYLFCNNYGSASYYTNARVYTLKIWYNGVLVRNFIPALRNSDETAGMYDLVNDVFYINQGTGSFIAGPRLSNGNNTVKIYKKDNKVEANDFIEI